MLARRVACCLFLLVAGCGGGSSVAPVSGVVTLNGSPLADASVSTQPIASGEQAPPGSFARTDAQGRFTLAVVGGGSGAAVGKHRVVISKGDRPPTNDESSVGVKELIPERYNAKTGLTLEVPARGRSDVRFELTSP